MSKNKKKIKEGFPKPVDVVYPYQQGEELMKSLEAYRSVTSNFYGSSTTLQPSKMARNDQQIRPSYYNQHPSGVECIEIIKHYDFCVGNAMKYLWRAGLKNSGIPEEDEIRDLKKAIQYIEFKIESLEKSLEDHAKNK